MTTAIRRCIVRSVLVLDEVLQVGVRSEGKVEQMSVVSDGLQHFAVDGARGLFLSLKVSWVAYWHQRRGGKRVRVVNGDGEQEGKCPRQSRAEPRSRQQEKQTREREREEQEKQTRGTHARTHTTCFEGLLKLLQLNDRFPWFVSRGIANANDASVLRARVLCPMQGQAGGGKRGERKQNKTGKKS